MANYATLKAAVDAAIKANGLKEITGPVLNSVLKAMINSLGAGYEMAGVATPDTNPGTPDYNAYWLASQGGTYTNFGGATLPTGLSILLWNGSWSSQTFFAVDVVPVAGSTNPVSSGAVYTLKRQVDGVSGIMKTTEEDGAYFTNEDGDVFMQYDVFGFDVAKISESFKAKLNGNSNIILNIDEDLISLITDRLGNSAVNWTNEHGLNANKVNYYLARKIRERYIKDMEEWNNLAVGMFIHWGVYSVLAGHYQGVDIDGQIIDYQSTIIAEWIMKQARIPKNIYMAYQSQFTTNGWNADAIAKLAYDCGMKYIVITAKHHEGFALYDSQVIPWNISTSGAAGKDPMQELKNACEKYGVKFCIYYSVGRDWTAEGGFDQEWTNNNADPYTNTQHEAYMESCANALKEIVDRYNPYIIWYDGYINTELNEIVYDAQKNYYPHVVVNDRLCHNPAKGDYATGEGAYYQGDRSEWPNAENCYCVMKNTWGYNENQDTPEYANSLYDLLCKQILESRARTQNALINIGPKGDGSVSVNAINALNSLADFVNKYGSFENTRGLNYYTFPSWGRAIIKGSTLRCYVWGGNTTILVDGVYTKPIKGVKVWDIQDPESVNNYTVVSDYRIRVGNIPVSAQHPSVVDIEFGNDIVYEEYSTIIDSDNTIIGASAFQSHGSMYLTNFDGVVQFGGWTAAGRITTIFRYDGVSGNHAVKLYIPSKSSNGIPITIKITDLSNNSTTTLTATSDDTTTQESVYLTNGHLYKVEISKTANEWFNLSQIEFILI